MQAKVSVIVPFFDSAATLPRCLDSLCRQSLREIEIVCVDDASTDASAEVVRRCAGRDSRVRLLRLAANGGPGTARNAGIRAASGDYVGFLDADDFVSDDFYGRLYDAALRTGADIAKGTISMLSADGERTVPGVYDINGLIEYSRAYFAAGFTSAIYDRRMLLSEGIFFPEGLIHFEDPPFAILAALSARHIEIDSSAVYSYVENPLSTTHNLMMRHLEDHIKATELVLDFLRAKAIANPEAMIVKIFLRDQLLAWGNREDVGEDEKSKAQEAIRAFSLDAEFDGEYRKWRQEWHKSIVLSRLRKRLRNNDQE